MVKKPAPDRPPPSAASRPLAPRSLLARAADPLVAADSRWFDKRRKAAPAPKKKPRRDRPIVLPKALLERSNTRIPGGAAIAGHAPPEAPRLATPRHAGREERALLRRFDGTAAVPLCDIFIEGNDDRFNFRDAAYPWCCIGRIQKPGGWASATLVGRTFIVTALHALDGLWKPDQPLTKTITFTPASFDGESLLGKTWRANVINIAAWSEVSDLVGYDFAICQLDQPMGDWLGHFGTRWYWDGWNGKPFWETVGYPCDLGASKRPTYQSGITVSSMTPDPYVTVELDADADLASGQSGGPLWAEWDDGGHQIIGITAAHDIDHDDNLFGGGAGLTTLVQWGRDNWG